MTRVLPFRTPADQSASIAEVVPHLKKGGLLAYPTETVYGFGCLLIPDALERLSALKGGRDQKPFLLLLPDIASAPQLKWTAAASALATTFWPGPLTLALEAPEGEYPGRVTSGGHTVAVRITPHPGMRALLTVLGRPITSTSANPPGRDPARDAKTIVEMLAELAADDTLILDGGPARSTTPSTLVDCSVDPPRILRAGAIPVAEIERCLHDLRA